MKHKWIPLSFAVLFFLTAVTFYVNRIVLPTVVQKIAVEQAQNYLKRKVEIESLHFNWLRGLVINKIKIYQKNSTTDVLAQAERISLGIIFIPGLKQHKLNLPFIHVYSLSLHLIHQADDQWNFSDLLTAPAKDDKPSAVAVSIGGIAISDGKIRLDDLSPQGIGTELFDEINLKAGLSYQGITFDSSISIPQKQGLVSILGTYQPLNQSLKATTHLKNIKPLDYLGLIPVKLPITVASGTIKQIDAQIEYSPKKINVQGNWSIKNINVTFMQNNIKTDMDVKNANLSLQNNTNSIKGEFNLSNTQIFTPTSSCIGTFKANIGDFLMSSPDDIAVQGALEISNLKIKLPHDQSFQGQLSLEINQGHWQKDSASLDGLLIAHQILMTLNDQQSIKGDLKINHLKLQKDKNGTRAIAELNLHNVDVRIPGKIFKGNLNAPALAVSLNNQNEIKLQAPFDLENFNSSIDKTKLTGFLHLKDLDVTFDQNKQTLEAKVKGVLQEASVKLDAEKNFTTNAHFNVYLLYPIKHPAELQYNGELSVDGARFEGLPFGPISDINLTSSITTDAAAIENLSLSLLDTPIKASGNVKNFLKPDLDIALEAGVIDLDKAKAVAPDLLHKYGIKLSGKIASFKLKYEGPALDPSKAKINGEGELQNVNVESFILKQNLKDISGTIKASGNALSWEDFNITVMGRPLVLTGSLIDFKNPKVKTSLSSQGIELKIDIDKNDNIVDIKNISGHYLSSIFNASGSVDLSNKIPQLDIKSDLKFKLEDTSNFLPDLKKTTDPLKLSGLVTTTASIKGPASDWKKWQSTANIQSDLLTIAGLKFDNFKVDVAQDEGKLNKLNITSTFYDGTLNIVTTADLTDPAIPFETALHLENADLSKLKNDTGAKDEDLRGFLAITTMVNATIKDILKLKGNGAFNISQGYLMEKKFSSLFLIPELSNLTFTEASANYTIENQKVSTENFALTSQGAVLHGKGWVDFNHQLQFELHPEFNADAISQSNSLRSGPSALIASAAGEYLTINIDGTIDKPQVHTIKKPSEILKKTGQIIKDNVGQILQGIFQ